MTEKYLNYMKISEDDLITFFLDFRENYAAHNLSINDMAYDYDIPIDAAKELMIKGAQLHKEKGLYH